MLTSTACLFFAAHSWAADQISERDVIQTVVKQNYSVLAALFGPQIAETEIMKAQSQFDTKISGQVYYNLDKGDTENVVFGTDNRTFLYDTRVEKKFSQGVTGAMSFSNQRNSSNSTFATDPVFFETKLRFEAAAPMLQNRFGKTDQNVVKLARSQQKTSASESLQQIQDQIAIALNRYWSWVAAYRYVEIAERFLKYSRDFERVNGMKKGLGLVEQGDLYAAQALVVEREAELLRAKNLREDFKKQLTYYLGVDETLDLKTQEKLAKPKNPYDMGQAMQIALASRPDYQALLQDAKSKDIEIAIAKDQKWPMLDLFASMELNSVDPSIAESFKETYAFQHPNLLLGARFNLLLENRLAKSQLEKGQLEKGRVLVRIKELQSLIQLEIDERSRELQLQTQEVQKFSQASNLQKGKLEAEVGKFMLGRSDTDTLVRYQNDYLEAERRHLDAQVRLEISWVELRKSLALLLPAELKGNADETRGMVR